MNPILKFTLIAVAIFGAAWYAGANDLAPDWLVGIAYVVGAGLWIRSIWNARFSKGASRTEYRDLKDRT